ncbi:MAG: hypothetical protein EXX96DRAFT_646249 [Benjaminiella poitrasii]|nr:MAG: hypothetical protein EXX96DRAFT_646249 [Benjaminiella poitrasii]
MLFDRYKNSKSKPLANEKTKKLSLANSLFRRLPFHFSSTFNANQNNNHTKKKYDHHNHHHQQTKKHNVVRQPTRSSMSLPDIVSVQDKSFSTQRTPKPSTSSPQQPSLIKAKSLQQQRKRFSAEQRRRQRWASMQDVHRHSLTFGRLPTSKATAQRLTLTDLSLSPDQLAKLERLIATQPSTRDEDLLAKLGNTIQPSIVPHRSMSHQHLPSSSPFQRKSLSRTQSESHANKFAISRSDLCLEPADLARALTDNSENVMLIDVRNLIDYQNRRIRDSINVNLPSLLIKRYQRGTVSNFNLENFITTAEGREIYQLRKQEDVQPSQTSLHDYPFSTILEQKALEAVELKKKKNETSKMWVVYDQHMSEDDPTSPAWTLLSVLERVLSTTKNRVRYLQGGIEAFQDTNDGWILSFTSTAAATTSLTTVRPNSANYGPRRSISYTLGESKNDVYNKRASLFTLDTHVARMNNANALARREKQRSQKQSLELTNNRSSLSLNSMHDTDSLATLEPSSSTFPNPASDITPFSLNRVVEDDEILTAEISPRTESDFDFVISEVIPGFLFVGPEIETSEQANQLVEVRHIKRVLNMAEECDDQGLMQFRDTLIYHKIAARDTLEMKNIELAMMEAVHFIEEAKKKHEPIYVHCKAGKSRSITAILAYLINSERWTLKRAYRHVIKVRPNMSPNIGFITELMKMEGKVHDRVSSFLESSDWQTTALPSPEYTKELIQLEKAWRAETTRSC